ncbi:MAG TPA: dihydrofolate reductase family protein [Propionibacteriaceae bacterium]|nr:dihydrofolate reductase family protein [Propionibacteriaceae bacterium]
MKTQYYTATSIDGFIADPDNSLEWLFQFESAEVGEQYATFIAHVGAVAMGSTTFEWIVRQTDLLSDPTKWSYPMPTWVFSSRGQPTIAGADIRYVSGDVRPVHAEMVQAAAGKNIWLVGGGDLVGQFADHGLLDEIILGVAPVTLGAGAPLLPRRITNPPMRLVEASMADGTFAMLRYELGQRADG